MNKPIRRKTLIDGVYARLIIKVYYAERLGKENYRTGFLTGQSSSFRIKTNFKEVRRKALLNALIGFERSRGTMINGTNELIELDRSIQFQIVDYEVLYIEQYLYKDKWTPVKIKRVNRRGKSYNYVFNPDGKIKTIQKWTPLTNNKVQEGFTEDFNELGIEE